MSNRTLIETELFEVIRNHKDVVRMGIIPYSFNNDGQKVILLGLKTNELFYGDFGGGRKKYESPMDCLKREINEELGNTLNLDLESIVQKNTTSMIKFVTRNKKYFIQFFVHIDYNDDINSIFQKQNVVEHTRIDWFNNIGLGKLCPTIKPFYQYINKFLTMC